MCYNFLKKSGLIILFSCCCISTAFTQERTSVSSKRISDDDKAAIINLFKGVDSRLYRLEFNGGKEVYGTKRISMRELEQVRKVRNPLDSKGYVIFSIMDEGVMQTFAVTTKTKGSDLATLLGKEKAAKLNVLLTKYGQ